MASEARANARTPLDAEVLVVGAGISGIGAAIELQRRGHRDLLLLEAAETLGGTWRDNTYPGVAVDIPFASYCFSYATDYPWSRIFPAGAEILAYVRQCADRYGVTPRVRCNARVRRAVFDAASDTWTTTLENGTVLRSRYLIAATGLLSQPKYPHLPGLETFSGTTMHTARWAHDCELRGKRIGVIGTGATAVQVVPELAQQAGELRVFQRTPIWVSPRLDRPLGPRLQRWLHRSPALRCGLRVLSESGIQALSFAIVNYRRLPFLVRGVRAVVSGFMRRSIGDAALQARLVPDYELGCKRPTMSNAYLQAFREPHVCLVTSPIQCVCSEGVVTRDGALHPLDVLILATGFLTTEQGNAPSFEVVGRDGVELGQFWQDCRLQAYRGVAVPGFPNFFLTAGPYSGGFNWFTMLERHLHHIGGVLDRARRTGSSRVEVDAAAHARYMAALWASAEGTVFRSAQCRSANSFYLDRHGDASLPLPRTPWMRVLADRVAGTRGYDFSGSLRSGDVRG